jgi:hypothetical protein
MIDIHDAALFHFAGHYLIIIIDRRYRCWPLLSHAGHLSRYLKLLPTRSHIRYSHTFGSVMSGETLFLPPHRIVVLLPAGHISTMLSLQATSI